MFLFRSAFWLFIGFLLVAPHGTDFGTAASSLRDQAVKAGVQAGENLIVSQITANSIGVLSVVAPAQVAPAGVGILTVMPRPRPAAIG